MITINAKVKERLAKGIKKFQPILAREIGRAHV